MIPASLESDFPSSRTLETIILAQLVTDLAGKIDVSIPQLGIRYLLQLGLLTLPKTANPAPMKENAALDFVISDEDRERLKNGSHRRVWKSQQVSCVLRKLN